MEKLPEYNQNNLQSIKALEDIIFLAKSSEQYEKFEDRFIPKKYQNLVKFMKVLS